jgi:hypothetical protein
LTSFSTSLALAVWDVLESAITTANSIGVKVKNNLDATVSSRSTLTAAEAADAVWDETLADHQASGSTGAALAAASSPGDPWATPLPGSYGAGTAGNILGNRLDVAVSSRASGSDYTAARAVNLDNLDTTVSSRAPASTALSNATWTDARAAKLDNLDATVSSRSTLTASDVWNHTTRTLTSFGSLVSDIWGYTTSVGVSAVTVLERVYRTLVNKMKVNKESGSVTLYADNNINTAATGSVTESDQEVTRNKLSWQ